MILRKTAALRSRPPVLMVLVAVSMLQPVAINMYVPSLPGMERALATDATSIQLTITVYLIATAVGQIIMGPLSDRFGRRPVLLFSLLVLGIDYLIMWWAPTFAWLLLGRLIAGAAASTYSTCNAFIAPVSVQFS